MKKIICFFFLILFSGSLYSDSPWKFKVLSLPSGKIKQLYVSDRTTLSPTPESTLLTINKYPSGKIDVILFSSVIYSTLKSGVHDIPVKFHKFPNSVLSEYYPVMYDASSHTMRFLKNTNAELFLSRLRIAMSVEILAVVPDKINVSFHFLTMGFDEAENEFFEK